MAPRVSIYGPLRPIHGPKFLEPCDWNFQMKCVWEWHSTGRNTLANLNNFLIFVSNLLTKKGSQFGKNPNNFEYSFVNLRVVINSNNFSGGMGVKADLTWPTIRQNVWSGDRFVLKDRNWLTSIEKYWEWFSVLIYPLMTLFQIWQIQWKSIGINWNSVQFAAIKHSIRFFK